MSRTWTLFVRGKAVGIAVAALIYLVFGYHAYGLTGFLVFVLVYAALEAGMNRPGRLWSSKTRDVVTLDFVVAVFDVLLGFAYLLLPTLKEQFRFLVFIPTCLFAAMPIEVAIESVFPNKTPPPGEASLS